MARTKNIKDRRPPQRATTNKPQETAASAVWTAVIELGASSGQAMTKKPGGRWELVRWAQGFGASSVGGAEAIPALTAVQKRQGGQPLEIRHGHAAVRARKKNPTDWEMFAYPKFVFMGEGTTPEILRTLELQKKKAAALETTSKDLAIAFFRHMISEVVGQTGETFKIYVNISDRWRNSNVQELMLSFQSVRAKVILEHVDECLSSLVGRISSGQGELVAGQVYVVVNCGHSTMNVGLAEIANGPTYKVHRYEEYAAGAGEINMAVEEKVRAINRANGTKSSETNVWEVSECIDELFKPEPETEISTRYGIPEDEWEQITESASTANRNLDQRRPDLSREILAEALAMAKPGFHVLLTGGGSRSPTLEKAFENVILKEFPVATLHKDEETHVTAVLAGLMRIADEPKILSVKEVPVSLWLRSDPDETTDDQDWNSVVRICTQGQDMRDTDSVRDRASASHPIHIELLSAKGEAPLLDLSIFGTPAGVSDEQIIQGWNDDEFAYTSVDKVTEFGRFEHQLPASFVSDGRAAFHVYVYAKVARLSVELYAVSAPDGHKITSLEKTPFEEAFPNPEVVARLANRLANHGGVDLDVVRLKQVARPESLSAQPRNSPSLTSKSQRSISSSGRPSLSNVGSAEQDSITVANKKKQRKRLQPSWTEAQQQRLGVSAAKRGTLSHPSGFKARRTIIQDTELEM